MKHRVYYCPSPFENLEIKTEDFENHKGYSYTFCPVWNHRFNRTLICFSPCDFSMSISNNIFKYQIDNGEVIQVNINDLDDDYYDDYVHFSLDDIKRDEPVVQLVFTSIHVWTDYQDEYTWFEMLDHPLTSVKNNFYAIGGWWNIANHARSTSLAVRMCDSNKTLNFKKGDPIYRIRFYTQDMNDEISFLKKSSSKVNLEEQKELMQDRMKLFENDRNLMNRVLFEKDTRKKCPYHYNNFENV